MILLVAFMIAIGSIAKAQTGEYQKENTGIFRIVPGDPFVGGGERGDGCRYEEGKTEDRVQIQMSFGTSKLEISSDDEALRAGLRETAVRPSISNHSARVSHSASVKWTRDTVILGGGACEITVAPTYLAQAQSSREQAQPEGMAKPVVVPGLRFDVLCQPSDRGVLQGQIFCRLRTRGR